MIYVKWHHRDNLMHWTYLIFKCYYCSLRLCLCIWLFVIVGWLECQSNTWILIVGLGFTLSMITNSDLLRYYTGTLTISVWVPWEDQICVVVPYNCDWGMHPYIGLFYDMVPESLCIDGYGYACSSNWYMTSVKGHLTSKGDLLF